MLGGGLGTMNEIIREYVWCYARMDLLEGYLIRLSIAE